MLGEWYYKVGQEWHDEPGFEAFGDIHKEFHETAKNLVTAALNGESWREIERLVDEMTRQSGAIMQYLQQLAKVGLLENYQSPPNPFIVIIRLAVKYSHTLSVICTSNLDCSGQYFDDFK